MRKQEDLPDVLTLHIESGASLEKVAMHKFLKHSFVVLDIVAGDVPNLEK